MHGLQRRCQSHRGRQIALLGDHELLDEEGEVQVLGVEAVQASRRPTAARMNRDALGRRCEAKRRSPEVAALGKRGGRADVAGRWPRQGRTADGGRGNEGRRPGRDARRDARSRRSLAQNVQRGKAGGRPAHRMKAGGGG